MSKKLRKQKCLFQRQPSKLADISYNAVIKLELKNITNPSIDTPYFSSMQFHNNIYEKVYTDEKDVILFWKTKS